LPDLTPAEARARAALRKARQQARMSQWDLARQLGWQQASVSRVETGDRPITAADARAWMLATVPQDAEEVLRLLEKAAVQALTWRTLYGAAGGEAARQLNYVELEREAARIVVFQPAIVPGLAQTPEYMRRVLELFGVAPEQIPAMIAARLQRQRILHEPGRDVLLLVTEAALSLRVGPVGVLLEQIARLSSLIDLPSVTVGVISYDVPAPALPLTGYELLLDADGGGEVLAEVLAGEVNTRGEDVTARYVADVEAWLKVAATGEAARVALDRVRSAL
jgi:transcriptional regulator with XRE-family HTH domain